MVLGYDEEVALEASDFVVPARHLTAVIGPNGSGKTTLLTAIAGLLGPREGSLEIDLPEPRHRHIALVPQTSAVNATLPVTVREVVAMGRYARLGPYRRFRPEDREVCDRVMAHMRIDRLAARHLDELSGGQAQRVFVAQGLVQEADLLLLDEPVTGLDLVSRDTILGAIREERARGTTVVMTTHDLDEAAIADHVLLLASRVVAEGPPEQVVTAPSLSEAYGVRIVELQGGLVLDDPHHRPASGRHVHFDRTGHGDHPAD